MESESERQDESHDNFERKNPSAPEMSSSDSESEGSGEQAGSLSLSLAIKALTKFDGKESVQEWIYGIDDLRKCLRAKDKAAFFKIVRTFVRGEASEVIRGSDEDWASTRKTLFEIYGEKRTLTEIERCLAESRQDNGESVDAYATRVRQLGIKYLALLKKTYTSVDRKMIMDRVKDNFVRGLNVRIYQAVVNSKFTDLSEAQATASRIERDFMARADLYGHNSMSRRMGELRLRETYSAPADNFSSRQRRLTNKDHEGLDAGRASGDVRPLPGRGRVKPGITRDPDDMRCYACNEYGHIATFCRNRGRNQPPRDARVSNQVVRQTAEQGPPDGRPHGSGQGPLNGTRSRNNSEVPCSYCGKLYHGIETCYTRRNALNRAAREGREPHRGFENPEQKNWRGERNNDPPAGQRSGNARAPPGTAPAGGAMFTRQ